MKLFKFFHRYDLKKGIALVLLAWLCFSTLYMISKLIQTTTSVPTMLFFRNVSGLIILIPMLVKKWPKIFEVKDIKVVLIRSFMGLLNLFFIFMAVEKISLVNTTLLNNSAPFFVPFILWFWMKVPVNHKLWPAVVIGFIGIALILKPDQRIFNLGAMYALLSGICLAITLVTMRMTTKSENLTNFLLYFFLIGAALTLPFAIFNWQIDTFPTLIGLLSIGLLSFLGQICIFHGMKYGKANQLAPFTYSTVIFSGVYEWLIWGRQPDWVALIGMLLIIASGVWIVYISPPPKDIPE